jgi:hypothetical protein
MSDNSKLFNVGSIECVDIETGESVPVEGGGLRMMPGPPGTCPMCHVAHDPEEPHNQESLPYQMKFRSLKGRFPTWSDAMAHCTPEMQELWRANIVSTMKKHGLEIPEDLQ